VRLVKLVSMSNLPNNKREAAKSESRKFSAPALVLGLLGLVVLCWITATYLRRSLRLGYVDSAVASVITIVAEEKNFAEAHPDLGYTCTLSELSRNQLVAGLVKSGQRNGYAFELAGCRSEGSTRPSLSYQVTARPLHRQMPAFCSDHSGVVRSDEGGSPAKCLQSGTPL